MEKVRIDKWLWSVRMYKSRSLATDACKTGKVKINNIPTKASAMVSTGDLIQLRKGGFLLSYKVTELIEKRVSAPLAQQCYEDLTPEAERNKYKDWFIGKGKPERRERGSGRPTKRERRSLDAYKGRS